VFLEIAFAASPSGPLCPQRGGVAWLRKCSLAQAGQVIASYSFSGAAWSSSSHCWTYINVAGQVKKEMSHRLSTTAP